MLETSFSNGFVGMFDDAFSRCGFLVVLNPHVHASWRVRRTTTTWPAIPLATVEMKAKMLSKPDRGSGQGCQAQK